MYEETQPGMQCQEFDTLLSDALDGRLSGRERDKFEAHRNACATCGPVFAEAQTGMQLLRGLAEVEPPANFVHNVLAATTGRVEQRTPARRGESWWEKIGARLRQGSSPLLQPKVAMSFAMAFFSISLVLNIAGFKIADLRHVDLSPNAIVRDAYEAQGRVVKFYENIRFVYEIESRVQELKRATTTPEDNPPPVEKDKSRKDHSGNPDRKYQNYSRELESQKWARLFDHNDSGSKSVIEPTAKLERGSRPDAIFARREA